MYRAFAPFSETVRGDRRVTGTRRGSAAVSAAFWERGRLGGIREGGRRSGMGVSAQCRGKTLKASPFSSRGYERSEHPRREERDMVSTPKGSPIVAVRERY